jgi:hypothetical protein
VLRVAVALALMLGLYVGAYCAMVEPTRSLLRKPHPVYVIRLGAENFRYRRYSKAAALFAPIHWLERRIRPHVWERE